MNSIEIIKMHKKATQEEGVKTLVWWDIDSCPVPDGYDAGLVGPSIASALNKAGYSGPLTITAVGNLNHTLKQRPDVLPAISSSGIVLKHLPYGPSPIMHQLHPLFLLMKQVPHPLMLISAAEKYHPRTLSPLQDLGYTILQAFPQQTSPPVVAASSSLVSGKWWLWESLLKDATDSWETSGHVKPWKCSETSGSPYRFYCTPCKFCGRSFEDFTTHLKSKDHALRELNMLDRPVRRNKMWCIEKGFEQEWDRMSL